jgi:hypothetical protein
MSTSLCITCGTTVLIDDESGAEAHLDRALAGCGEEGKISRLADHIDGSRSIPVQPRRLSIVR